MGRASRKGLFWGFVLLGLPLSGVGQKTQQQFSRPVPKYKVRLEPTVTIPMRDGVKLSTDLYFPEDAGEKLPVILVRTPYNKNTWREQTSDAYVFASQGYVVAVEDMRGRYESEGEYIFSIPEGRDGYDAVSWLATQPWSTGKVGTYGCSYNGDTQVIQAPLRNPHLGAMIPQAAGGVFGSAGGRYRQFSGINGGAIELAMIFDWFRLYGSKIFLRPPSYVPWPRFLEFEKYFHLGPSLPSIDYHKIWRTLPLIDMMKKAGAPPTDWEIFVSHEPADPWWNQFGYIKDTDRFDVPALQIDSWYDYGVAEVLYQFNLFRTNAESVRGRDNQFVIISPTGHCRSESATEQTVVGQRNMGDARFAFYPLYLRWFDHWLKGIENGITSMPKAQIYVMGRNQWRGENEWPPARTQFTNWFLHSDGGANSRLGTGSLSLSKPGDEPPDRFLYDPMAPVPSRGGSACCTGSPEVVDGSVDQSEVESRHDVLIYSTPPLERGIEVTGPLQAVLYVSSSARDTDFTAKLVDVYPDATAYNVQEGILRARYRQGFEKKVWMQPSEIYELKIDMHVTSNYFEPGHRIRLEIASSNFPRFDRNLNTGGSNFDETAWVVAENTVHHSDKYPSHVVLPVIP